jgi:hypothetical protein
MCSPTAEFRITPILLAADDIAPLSRAMVAAQLQLLPPSGTTVSSVPVAEATASMSQEIS